MSERYGSPGELQEMLGYFEDWLNEEMEKARAGNIERYIALRDALSYIVSNP